MVNGNNIATATTNNKKNQSDDINIKYGNGNSTGTGSSSIRGRKKRARSVPSRTTRSHAPKELSNLRFFSVGLPYRQSKKTSTAASTSESTPTSPNKASSKNDSSPSPTKRRGRPKKNKPADETLLENGRDNESPQQQQQQHQTQQHPKPENQDEISAKGTKRGRPRKHPKDETSAENGSENELLKQPQQQQQHPNRENQSHVSAEGTKRGRPRKHPKDETSAENGSDNELLKQQQEQQQQQQPQQHRTRENQNHISAEGTKRGRPRKHPKDGSPSEKGIYNESLQQQQQQQQYSTTNPKPSAEITIPRLNKVPLRSIPPTLSKTNVEALQNDDTGPSPNSSLLSSVLIKTNKDMNRNSTTAEIFEATATATKRSTKTMELSSKSYHATMQGPYATDETKLLLSKTNKKEPIRPNRGNGGVTAAATATATAVTITRKMERAELPSSNSFSLSSSSSNIKSSITGSEGHPQHIVPKQTTQKSPPPLSSTTKLSPKEHPKIPSTKDATGPNASSTATNTKTTMPTKSRSSIPNMESNILKPSSSPSFDKIPSTEASSASSSSSSYNICSGNKIDSGPKKDDCSNLTAIGTSKEAKNISNTAANASAVRVPDSTTANAVRKGVKIVTNPTILAHNPPFAPAQTNRKIPAPVTSKQGDKPKLIYKAAAIDNNAPTTSLPNNSIKISSKANPPNEKRSNPIPQTAVTESKSQLNVSLSSSLSHNSNISRPQIQSRRQVVTTAATAVTAKPKPTITSADMVGKGHKLMTTKNLTKTISTNTRGNGPKTFEATQKTQPNSNDKGGNNNNKNKSNKSDNVKPSKIPKDSGTSSRSTTKQGFIDDLNNLFWGRFRENADNEETENIESSDEDSRCSNISSNNNNGSSSEDSSDNLLDFVKKLDSLTIYSDSSKNNPANRKAYVNTNKEVMVSDNKTIDKPNTSVNIEANDSSQKSAVTTSTTTITKTKVPGQAFATQTDNSRKNILEKVDVSRAPNQKCGMNNSEKTNQLISSLALSKVIPAAEPVVKSASSLPNASIRRNNNIGPSSTSVIAEKIEEKDTPGKTHEIRDATKEPLPAVCENAQNSAAPSKPSATTIGTTETPRSVIEKKKVAGTTAPNTSTKLELSREMSVNIERKKGSEVKEPVTGFRQNITIESTPSVLHITKETLTESRKVKKPEKNAFANPSKLESRVVIIAEDISSKNKEVKEKNLVASPKSQSAAKSQPAVAPISAGKSTAGQVPKPSESDNNTSNLDSVVSPKAGNELQVPKEIIVRDNNKRSLKTIVSTKTGSELQVPKEIIVRDSNTSNLKSVVSTKTGSQVQVPKEILVTTKTTKSELSDDIPSKGLLKKDTADKNVGNAPGSNVPDGTNQTTLDCLETTKPKKGKEADIVTKSASIVPGNSQKVPNVGLSAEYSEKSSTPKSIVKLASVETKPTSSKNIREVMPHENGKPEISSKPKMTAVDNLQKAVTTLGTTEMENISRDVSTSDSQENKPEINHAMRASEANKRLSPKIDEIRNVEDKKLTNNVSKQDQLTAENLLRRPRPNVEPLKFGSGREECNVIGKRPASNGIREEGPLTGGEAKKRRIDHESKIQANEPRQSEKNAANYIAAREPHAVKRSEKESEVDRALKKPKKIFKPGSLAALLQKVNYDAGIGDFRKESSKYSAEKPKLGIKNVTNDSTAMERQEGGEPKRGVEKSGDMKTILSSKKTHQQPPVVARDKDGPVTGKEAKKLEEIEALTLIQKSEPIKANVVGETPKKWEESGMIEPSSAKPGDSEETTQKVDAPALHEQNEKSSAMAKPGLAVVEPATENSDEFSWVILKITDSCVTMKRYDKLETGHDNRHKSLSEALTTDTSDSTNDVPRKRQREETGVTETEDASIESSNHRPPTTPRTDESISSSEQKKKRAVDGSIPDPDAMGANKGEANMALQNEQDTAEIEIPERTEKRQMENNSHELNALMQPVDLHMNRLQKNENPGVGANRIRIVPISEKLEEGSIGVCVLKRLQLQYSEYEGNANSMPKPIIEMEPLQPEEVLPDVKTPSKNSVQPNIESERKSTPAVDRPALVHDVNIPDSESFKNYRPLRNAVLPPILLGENGSTNPLPPSMEHLPPGTKIDVMDRKTGLFLTGDEAIPIEELPGLLEIDASLEPIIPPAGSDQSSGRNIVREARSTPSAHICATVRKQQYSDAWLKRGSLVRVKSGKYKGEIGTLESKLPGGWSEVRPIVPGGKSTFWVETEFLTDKPETNKSILKKKRKLPTKTLQSFFTEAVEECFQESIAESVGGDATLGSENKNKKRVKQSIAKVFDTFMKP